LSVLGLELELEQVLGLGLVRRAQVLLVLLLAVVSEQQKQG